MQTPEQFFDELAATLSVHCDTSSVIVRVEINLAEEPPGLSFIRHVHNPKSVFSRGSDTMLQLPQKQVDEIRSKVQQVFGPIDSRGPALLSMILSIYHDGQWSSGGTMRTARSMKRPSTDNGND